MNDPAQTTKHYSNKDLEQRKTWYSPAADAYNQARPHYPEALIDRVIELTQLDKDATILEIGCGPGTATVSFAERGFSLLCLEPNPDFCAIARRNCANYSNVEVKNTSFEEWKLESQQFSAVLAATSIHWIPPDVAYPKIANALQDDGALILLWNVPAILPYDVYQAFQAVYQVYAPSLAQYKDKETHEVELRKLEQMVIRSGHFKDVVFEQIEWDVTYNTDEYLTLLSTFSQYLELDPQCRNALFADLRQTIGENGAGRLQLLNLSAFHLAWKR